MIYMLEWLGLTAAFLPPTPAWQEPTHQPARGSLGAGMIAAMGVIMVASVAPILIALDIYKSEGVFRTQCEASGGRLALSRDARHPYRCVHG